MYAMKEIASSMFRMIISPNNRKIFTIDQLTCYEANHSANIHNIKPLVRTSSDAYSIIDMGPNIFKGPYFLEAYHGAPPLLQLSIKVCVVSSNGTDIRDIIPPSKASPHIEVPLVEELLSQEFLGNPTTPLILDSLPPSSKGKSWFARQSPKPLPKLLSSTPHLEA
jgi:hypothetical protein